jgi:hypothetical protein
MIETPAFSILRVVLASPGLAQDLRSLEHDDVGLLRVFGVARVCYFRVKLV